MPGQSGPEVAEAVRAIHPGAAVLFASGYTADAISDRAPLPPGIELIEKPYTAAELARRVRSALDERRRQTFDVTR
jgi:FixJ family two-component response regulator